MLINHAHHFAADAESLVESNTLVKCDCCDVDSFAVFVPVGKKERPSEMLVRGGFEESLMMEFIEPRLSVSCCIGLKRKLLENRTE